MVLIHVQSFAMIFALPSLWSYIPPYLLDRVIKDDHMLNQHMRLQFKSRSSDIHVQGHFTTT